MANWLTCEMKRWTVERGMFICGQDAIEQVIIGHDIHPTSICAQCEAEADELGIAYRRAA